MPNYDFLNTQTGEQFTERMSMNEREQYLANNPHIQQLLTRMNMFAGSPKNDDGWKENMSRIAEAHPNSALAERAETKFTDRHSCLISIRGTNNL